MIGPIASDAIDPTETLARISYCRSEAVQPLSRRARLGAYRCLNCDNLYACTGQIPRRRGISTIGMAIGGVRMARCPMSCFVARIAPTLTRRPMEVIN
jgi:hypothetical protein